MFTVLFICYDIKIVGAITDLMDLESIALPAAIAFTHNERFRLRLRRHKAKNSGV